MRPITLNNQTVIIAHKGELPEGADCLPLDFMGFSTLVLVGRMTRGRLAGLLDLDGQGEWDSAIPLEWSQREAARKHDFNINEWVWVYPRGGKLGGQPLNLLSELYKYKDAIWRQLALEAPFAAQEV